MVKQVLSTDGSYTAYSEAYGEHYHSTKDGALTESLCKHVIPAITSQRHKPGLQILDICFGLGFNTLATLWYMREHRIEIPLRIYSPELDRGLIEGLEHFEYPEQFHAFKPVIEALGRTGSYKDEHLFIELYIGDARAFVRQCELAFDIIYQDAFSPASNPMLWTKEYFSDLARLLKPDGILTTYSMALKTRLALFHNGFNVYINEGEGHRDATVAAKGALEGFVPVDMAYKIYCNPGVEPLSDADFV